MANTKKIIIGVSIAAILLYFVATANKAFAKVSKSGIIRGIDAWGSGAFGASRDGHIHEGVDYVMLPGESVYSPISGTIERIAYPYSGDGNYKGLVISNNEYEAKIFYVLLTASIGQKVKAGAKIAEAQNIAAKYGENMTNHIHVEIREKKTGKIIDPTKLLV